ncbi:hypothetical protein [Acetobacter sp. LMG 32666]|uniref:hypothetical protein n=1 Tax=Acetobacter sp. LMG 32666 TaxID=2959295 RepID=UPI0030C860A9
MLAVVMGYFASSAFFTVLSVLLVGMGMPRAESVTLGIMLTFIVYLCLIVWAFAARAAGQPVVVFCLLILCGYGLPLFVRHGG